MHRSGRARRQQQQRRRERGDGMSTAAAKAVAEHVYARPYRAGETLPTTGAAQIRKQRKRRREAGATAAAAASSGPGSLSLARGDFEKGVHGMAA